MAKPWFMTIEDLASPLGNGRYPLVWKNRGLTLPDYAESTPVSGLVADNSGASQGAQIVRKLCAE